MFGNEIKLTKGATTETNTKAIPTDNEKGERRGVLTSSVPHLH